MRPVTILTNTPILALVAGSWITAFAADDPLYEGFLNPPAAARPFVRWWWNGDCVTEKEILRELDLMKAAGIGGVEINPVAMPGGATPSQTAPLVWLSPEWNRMAGVATRGAKERGMIADMIVGSGWPFGGRFLKSGETIQAIGVTRKTLTGPAVFKAELKELMKAPAPRVVVADAAKPRLMYLRLVPKNATRIDECLDVANKVKPDGTVEFDIPAGEHTLHIGTWQESFTAVIHGAPGSDGQVLNHLNQAAVEGYLRRMSDQLGPALGGKLGNGLRAMFCDSIELSGANWTTDFPEEFRRRRGYPLEPWYPFALYDPHQGYRDFLPDDAKFADEVRRVRYDFNRTFVELFHERFTILRHATFKDGRILHGPMAYDLLLVANVASLEPETARAIEQYAKAGGKIAFVGNTPDRSAGFQGRDRNDQSVREAMAAAIKTGSRRVSVIAEPGKDELLPWIAETLARFDVRPAVRIAVPHPMLFQVHQQRDGREIFLFSNQDPDQPISFHGSFATGDLTPWCWNPETGERTAFPHGEKRDELDITLEPLGSLLLVFEPDMPGTALPAAGIDRSDAIDIKPPWQLTLEPAIGETETLDLKQLEDLGLSENKTLNRFAGKAVYRVKFNVADITHSMLSLGKVAGVSEVSLNGKALGVRWWGAEHLYDTQGTLRLDNNELEVRVTTVLSNYCRTLKDNRMAMAWAADHQPVSTGLLGPVSLCRKTMASANKSKTSP